MFYSTRYFWRIVIILILIALILPHLPGVFDSAKSFADFLASKEIVTILKIYGNKDDLQACHVFHLNQKLDIAKMCNDDECAFFKSFH